MAKFCVDRVRCCYCGGCVGVCPRDALELRETILFIDQSKCSGCGICMKFCPVDAIRNENIKSGV